MNTFGRYCLFACALIISNIVNALDERPSLPRADLDGDYTITWEANGRLMFLEERRLGESSWLTLSQAGETSAQVTGREEGVYEYRLMAVIFSVGNEYGPSSFINVGVESEDSGEPVRFRGGEYNIYTTDMNGDGVDDIYLMAADKLILLHGDIITPILAASELPDILIESAVTPIVHYLSPVEVSLDNTFGFIKNNSLAYFSDVDGDGFDDLSLYGGDRAFSITLDGSTENGIRALTGVNTLPELGTVTFSHSDYIEGFFSISWANDFKRLVLQESRDHGQTWVNIAAGNPMSEQGYFAVGYRNPGLYYYRLVEVYETSTGIRNYGPESATAVFAREFEPEIPPSVSAFDYDEYEFYQVQSVGGSPLPGIYFHHKTDTTADSYLFETITFPDPSDSNCQSNDPSVFINCRQLEVIISTFLREVPRVSTSALQNSDSYTQLVEDIDYYLEDLDGDGHIEIIFLSDNLDLYRSSGEAVSGVNEPFLFHVNRDRVTYTDKPDNFHEMQLIDIDGDGDLEWYRPNSDSSQAGEIVDFGGVRKEIVNEYYYYDDIVVPTLNGVSTGNFSVSEGGAAKYSIPLSLPQGTAGVAPEFSLSYSSQGGNGLLGKGWGLSGVETVTRCRQTLMMDGGAKPITWSEEDRFCLNGKRLIPRSSNDGVIEYETIIKEHVRITGYGNAGNPDYFRVEKKDGSVSYFGLYPGVDSSDYTRNVNLNPSLNPNRINHTLPSEHRTITWALGKIEDSAGNKIRYKYAHEDASDYRIANVYYAYGVSSSHSAEVEFIYDNRPDILRSFVAGFDVQNSKRLSRIVVKNAEQASASSGLQEVRRYNLHYGKSSPERSVTYSYISSIQECVGTNCLPATKFDWDVEVGVNFEPLSVSEDVVYDNSSILQMTPFDVNGDGYLDLAWMSGQTTDHQEHHQFLHYAVYDPATKQYKKAKFISGSGANPSTSDRFMDLDRATLGKTISFQPIDYNGDGRQDLVLFKDSNDTHRVFLSKPLVVNGEIEWLLDLKNYVDLRDSFKGRNYVYLDADSDGLQDILINNTNTGNTELWYLRKKSVVSDINEPYEYQLGETIQFEGFEIPLYFRHHGGEYEKDFSGVGDFNGDGKLDLIVTDRRILIAGFKDTPIELEENYYIAELENGKIITKDFLGHAYQDGGNLSDILKRGAKISPLNQYMVVDANMDSYSDLVVLHVNNSGNDDYSFRLNNGLNIGSAVQLHRVDTVNGGGYQNLDVSFNDLDFDGYPDFQFRDRTSGTITYKRWMPDLNKFSSASELGLKVEPGIRTSKDKILFYDATGDGHVDLVHFKNADIHLEQNTAKGDVGNITTITNGLGAETHIDYEPLNATAHYVGLGQTFNYSQTRSESPHGCTSHDVLLAGNTCHSLEAQDVDVSTLLSALHEPFDYLGDTGSGTQFFDDFSTPVFETTGSQFVVTRVEGAAPSSTLVRAPGLVMASAKSVLEYYYEHGRFQAGGIGLLGFKALTTVDVQTGVFSTTHYRQDWPFVGMPESTSRRNSNGDLLAETLNTYRLQGWDTQKDTWKAVLADPDRGLSSLGSFQPYTYKSVSTQYKTSSNQSNPRLVDVSEEALFTETTTTEKDNDGNVRSMTTLTEGEGLSLQKVIVNTFGQGQTLQFDDGRSLSYSELGRLTESIVTTTRENSISTKRSTFSYYNSGSEAGLLHEETLWLGGETLHKTTNVYDDFGNKTSAEVSAKNHRYNRAGALLNSDLQVRKATTQYDTRGRYVDSTTSHLLENNDSFVTSRVIERSIFGAPTLTDNGAVDANETRIQYDVLGREQSRQDSTGAAVSTEFKHCKDIPCPSGAVMATVKTTATGGTAISYADVLARTIREQTQIPGGKLSCVDTEYDALGRTLRHSQPFDCRGSAEYWAEYEHDMLGRVIAAHSPDENGTATQRTRYDGLKVVLTNALGHSKTSYKNGLGELIGVQDELGGSIHYEYDSHGNVAFVHHYNSDFASVLGGSAQNTSPYHNDPNVVTIELIYDDLNRKVAMKDPDKGDWEYLYNGFNELVWQRDAKDQVVTFDYDGFGRQKNRIDYEYTGNVEQHTRWLYDTEGVDGELVSNAAMKLTAVVMADSLMGEESSCTSRIASQCQLPRYDSLGRVVSNTTKSKAFNEWTSFTTRTQYGAFGRVDKQWDALDGDANGDGLSNADDALLSPRLLSGSTLLQRYNYSAVQSGTQNHYDQYGFLDRVSDLLTGELVYQLNDTNYRGQATSVLQGNGVTSNFGYFEESGRIRSQSAQNSVLFALQDIRYTWDQAGNLTSRYNDSRGAVNSSLTKMLSESFCYDALNRLVKANQDTLSTSVCSGLSVSEKDQSYDLRGNIRHKRDVGTYYYETSKAHAVSRIVGGDGDRRYIYDDNGNLSYDQLSSGAERRAFSYSSFDKPLRITKGEHVTEFVYGANRSRHARRDTDKDGVVTTVLYLGNVEKITKSSEPNKITWRRYLGKTAIYTLTTDANHQILNGAQGLKKRFSYNDHLGSLDVITDGYGTLVQSMSFNPWGERRNADTWDAYDFDYLLNSSVLAGIKDETSRGFTGHEMADEVGIIHMNGRIYDAKIARFLQADPFIQASTNSQSFNRYSYVYNNPLNATDPSGYLSAAAESYIRPAVAVVIAVIAAAACRDASCGLLAFSAVMATASAVGAMINGAGDRGIAIAAISGGVTAGLSAAIPDELLYLRYAAVATAGGITSVLQGGKFGHGFLASAAGSVGGPGGGRLRDIALRVGIKSIIGGSVSRLTGGKFANGAVTAVFSAIISEGARHVVDNACAIPGDNGCQMTNKQRRLALSQRGMIVDASDAIASQVHASVQKERIPNGFTAEQWDRWLSKDQPGRIKMLERMIDREHRRVIVDDIRQRYADIKSTYEAQLAEKNQIYLYKANDTSRALSTTEFISKHMLDLTKTIPIPFNVGRTPVEQLVYKKSAREAVEISQ